MTYDAQCGGILNYSEACESLLHSRQAMGICLEAASHGSALVFFPFFVRAPCATQCHMAAQETVRLAQALHAAADSMAAFWEARRHVLERQALHSSGVSGLVSARRPTTRVSSC